MEVIQSVANGTLEISHVSLSLAVCVSNNNFSSSVFPRLLLKMNTDGLASERGCSRGWVDFFVTEDNFDGLHSHLNSSRSSSSTSAINSNFRIFFSAAIPHLLANMFVSIQNGRLVKYNFMDDCKYRLHYMAQQYDCHGLDGIVNEREMRGRLWILGEMLNANFKFDVVMRLHAQIIVRTPQSGRKG